MPLAFLIENRVANGKTQSGIVLRWNIWSICQLKVADKINEITALLSGSQVAQPQFGNFNQGTIPTTDNAGIINTNFD